MCAQSDFPVVGLVYITPAWTTDRRYLVTYGEARYCPLFGHGCTTKKIPQAMVYTVNAIHEQTVFLVPFQMFCRLGLIGYVILTGIDRLLNKGYESCFPTALVIYSTSPHFLQLF